MAVMKSRREDVSEDHRPVKSRRRYKKEPSNILVNGRVNLESIPVDLVIEILSRLPAKSIARFRCVSKLWSSILRRPDFSELVLTRSQARPQLLFICHAAIKRKIGKLVFFLSHQPQYSAGNSSLASTATYRMKIPFKSQYERIWLINGLVFLRDTRTLAGRNSRAMMSRVCNPSTGQSLVLSISKTRERNVQYSYLGYDPIEKQFKVLSITDTFDYAFSFSQAYQVLTLGTKKISWENVECCIRHVPTRNVICINGVLYYQAYVSGGGTMIACFDIRSEKFSFIEANKNIIGLEGPTLINYNGKLGSLVSDDGPCFSGRSTSCELWILEDTEKHDWSKQHIHLLPPMWKDLVGDISELDVVGMTGGNEIVFSPHTHSSPFCVFYYNIEQNTIRRIEIQGLEGLKGNRVHTFLNHVENIKPIDGY